MKKLLLLLLAVMVLLTSCDETEIQVMEHGGTQKGREAAVALATKECAAAMDALLAGDSKTLAKIAGWEISRGYEEYFRYLAKATMISVTYSMELLEVRLEEIQGHEVYAVTFRTTFSNRQMFRLTAYCFDSDLSLSGLEIYRITNTIAFNRVPAGWQKAYQSIFWISLAFFIWMLVDICLRSMSKMQKLLWGAICLLTAGFSLSIYPGHFLVMPLFGWLFSFRDCILAGNLLTIEIYLPVGAMVYFFLRKKLTLSYLAKRKLYYEQRDALKQKEQEEQK